MPPICLHGMVLGHRDNFTSILLGKKYVFLKLNFTVKKLSSICFVPKSINLLPCLAKLRHNYIHHQKSH